MKRSEMIARIKTVFAQFYGMKVDDNFELLLSAAILNEIEKAGMLPPLTKIRMGGMVLEDTVWEDEDA